MAILPVDLQALLLRLSDANKPHQREAEGAALVQVTKAEEAGGLPDAQAVLIIEDWQEDLRKVTPRIIWTDQDSGKTQTQEKNVFLHRNRIQE